MITRDVCTSVLNAQMAFQPIAASKQLLDQANNAMELAQDCYMVGLHGIADLPQARLAQTQAEIGYIRAKFGYEQALRWCASRPAN